MRQLLQHRKPLSTGRYCSHYGFMENIYSACRDGDSYIVSGHKWWTSGAPDPRCKIAIFMGKTDSSATTYKQQSMILVPMDAPGVDVVRPLGVYGYDDAPHGHAEVIFKVRHTTAQDKPAWRYTTYPACAQLCLHDWWTDARPLTDSSSNCRYSCAYSDCLRLKAFGSTLLSCHCHCSMTC